MSTAATKPAPAPSPEDPPAKSPPRLESVDLLRGAVMVLMILDHVRDFFTDPIRSPIALDETTPPVFLTRWITHFCAPAFVFLAGTGVCLASSRGKSRPELSRFLVTRGLWLVFLELTVVRFGLTFNLDFQYLPAGVLWAIGWSMVALAGLIYLPMPVVAALGVLTMAGHDLLNGIEPESFGRFGWVWKVLHEQGSIALTGRFHLHILYPLIPWVGVMAAGYAFGDFLLRDHRRRQQLLFVLGTCLVGGFVTLRAINLYGDPDPWKYRSSPLFTAFSFVDCNKYPPSLLFLMMTLGPVILALAALDRDRKAGLLGRALITLGRVPLFYYLLQWIVIHALALVVALAVGRPIGWLVASEPLTRPEGSGYGLPTVYLMWAISLLLLYPACWWFADYKKRHRDLAWLSYF